MSRSRARRACRACGRSVAVVGGQLWLGAGTIANHKCRHGYPCREGTPSVCPSCSAVLDVKPEVLEPPCVFCSPLDVPEGAVPGGRKGCPACRRRGVLPADPDLLRELRETTVPVLVHSGRP